MYLHQPGLVHTRTIVFTAAYIVIPQQFCMVDKHPISLVFVQCTCRLLCHCFYCSLYCNPTTVLFRWYIPVILVLYMHYVYHFFTAANIVIPQPFCIADVSPSAGSCTYPYNCVYCSLYCNPTTVLYGWCISISWVLYIPVQLCLLHLIL